MIKNRSSSSKTHLLALAPILVENVSDDLREMPPLTEREPHGHDGEDAEGQGHHAHHQPPGPQVDTAAASLEADHAGGQEQGPGCWAGRSSPLGGGGGQVWAPLPSCAGKLGTSGQRGEGDLCTGTGVGET